jgi:hypothetical protein
MKYKAVSIPTNELVVYNDIHMWASNALYMPYSDFEFGPNKFYIGDVVDLANCRPEDKHSAVETWVDLKRKAGDNWIDGNHERMTVEQECIIVKMPGLRRAVLDHGDYTSWGVEKAAAYRSKPKTAGWFKRTFIVNTIETYEKSIGRTMSDSFANEAAKLALTLGCTIYIGGHLHPTELVKRQVGSVTVIALPRGKNTILV